MSDYALNIEKYIAHQIWFIFTLNNGRSLTTAYSKTIEPFIEKKNYKLCSKKSYHELDFNDFFDFATSELVDTNSNIDIFENGEIYLYDAIDGSYNMPSIISTDDNIFSLIGAGLIRRDNVLTIVAQIRTFEGFILSDEYNSILNSPFSKNLLSPQHNFPYIFVYLSMQFQKDSYVEVLRSEVVPPAILGVEDYSIHSIGRDNYYTNLPVHISYPQLMRQDREVLFERDEYLFEIVRLLPYLPNYYSFMYDLVLPRRIKVGKKGERTKKRGKNAKRTGKSKYKLVKSISVLYESDDSKSQEYDTLKRSWTPPAYRYVVRGHWRKLSQPHWIGRDPEGNEVTGKTWVHEYEKGEGEDVVQEIATKVPHQLIKIKQPISYARDVMKAHQNDTDGSHHNISDNNSQLPTKEWMYNERKKLNAGLRYKILKRDEFKCQLCGASGLDHGVRLEVDHINPITNWGRTEPANLRTSCLPCNRGKGTDKTAQQIMD